MTDPDEFQPDDAPLPVDLFDDMDTADFYDFVDAIDHPAWDGLSIPFPRRGADE